MSTNTTPSSPTRQLLLTAIAPLIWGTTYLVTSEWLPPGRPFTAAALRCLPAGLLLLLCLRRWPQRQDWGRLAGLAALNIGAFQALLFVAAYRLPGGVAAVVGAIQPLLVMGLAWLLDGRRPRSLALAAGCGGVLSMAALLLAPGAAWDAVGVAAALAGAACMAGGTFLSRRWRIELPVLPLTGWQLLLGGLMLLPWALWVDPPLAEVSAAQAAAYLYLSLVGTLLSYALWFRGLRTLPPVSVASLGLLSPLCAVLLGWLWLGQSLGAVGALGFLGVLLSIALVQRGSLPGASPTPPNLPVAAPSAPSTSISTPTRLQA